MSYVDSDFYNEFSGVITDKVDNKLDRASAQIDSLTFNRIVGIGFNNLTEFQKDKVKKAVCMHADFIEMYGEFINTPFSGYSVGDVSLNFNTNTVKSLNGVITSNEVYNYLSQTGLNCRKI